jgi:SAM-dependent methyltransferase
MNNESYLEFQCNICGNFNTSSFDKLGREDPSCKYCGSTVRMRAIIHILSSELFGKSLVICDFPKNMQISGMGMSDWEGYAKKLSEKLDYCNTFYHKEPKLDITSIEPSFDKRFDFIISSDVFEHIDPPISIAFTNLKKILKDTGFVIFTVPYTIENDDTREHFPDLFNYKIENKKEPYYLENITKNGIHQKYENLIFHGGEGFTLEMRLFSEKSLINEFSKAGFHCLKFYSGPFQKYGIIWKCLWSLPIIVRQHFPETIKNSKTATNSGYIKI